MLSGKLTAAWQKLFGQTPGDIKINVPHTDSETEIEVKTKKLTFMGISVLLDFEKYSDFRLLMDVNICQHQQHCAHNTKRQ